MKSKATREVFVIVFFTLIAVFTGLLQTIVYIRETPPGFVFPYPHNYVEDYYYYLHLMRQGFDGMWLATSRLTPEVFIPQFVNPFFLFLGHAARATDISLPLMYTIARASGATAIIILTYLLIARVLPDSPAKRFITLCIVFTSSYFWKLQDGGLGVAPLVHDWTELDPMFRLSYIPHHLWSKVFMIGVFLLMLKSLDSGKIRYTIVSGVITICMGFTSPVVLATFIPVIVFWFFFMAVTNLQKTFRKQTLLLFGIVSAAAFGVAIYHRVVQNQEFPWTSYLWWEKVQYQVTLMNYIQSMGINFIVFIFSLPLLVKLRNVGGLFVGWVTTSFVTLFLLAPFIPLTNSRYLGGYQFIPIGIGASIGLFRLFSNTYQRVNMVTRFAAPVLIVTIIFYNTVGFLASWKEHSGYILGNRWNMQVYVPVDIWNSFQFLNEKSQGYVVVAPLEISTMIPAFSNSKTISGHKTITYEYDKKNQELIQFYSRTNLAWAQEFLLRYKVKYVWAYNSDSLTDQWYTSLGLTMVYNSNSVRIYSHL